jgi:hypothetical protein
MKRQYTHSTTIRLTKHQGRKLKRASLAYGLTVSEIVRKFLEPLFDLSEAQIMVSGIMEDMKKPRS